MASLKRKATGIFEIEPGFYELRASAGVDPLTGKYRTVTRRFRGNLRDAKTERAKLVVKVTEGRFARTAETVDDLVALWLKELDRKGRSVTTIYEYKRRYEHDIRPALGSVKVSKVSTKMLTDLYGAHQRRGLSPASVRKIHATVSSMMTQACRWGWRDSNPAEWAEPPPLESVPPVVPTPAEVNRFIEAARQSRRPEHADILYLAATTGARRGEICAIRASRVNFEQGSLTISRNIVIDRLAGQLVDKTVKNRRARTVALDPESLAILARRKDEAQAVAQAVGAGVSEDPYLFASEPSGLTPWNPDTITQYFRRLAKRLELDQYDFKSFRSFMDTYAQELGYSISQVAMRAGHDPAVAAKHYTGRVDATDRRLASDVARLLERAD